MVDQNLIADLEVDGFSVDTELADAFAGFDGEDQLLELLGDSEECKAGSILKGRIVTRAGDDFVIDVGLKSEGLIPVGEWDVIPARNPCLRARLILLLRRG